MAADLQQGQHQRGEFVAERDAAKRMPMSRPDG
jgi:hypothetical protein